MKVVREVKCPNCKNIIQEIQIRRPHLRFYKKHKGNRLFRAIKGKYKVIIKKKLKKEKTIRQYVLGE